jgi:hypothetical protein
MQKQAQVKIIKLVNGDDIVCVLPAGEAQLPENAPLLRLEKPLQIKYIPQITPLGFRDYIALIRWTNYTGDQIVTIPKDKIMTITNASLEMSGNYEKISRNYHNLDKPKRDESYHRKEFSPEENKKLNEIFREFDDDEETPPTIH